MSDLAGANLMFEFSAKGLQKTIQNFVNIGPVAAPVVPNFELHDVGRKFDGIFDSVSIELIPQSPNLNLHLHYVGAVFRPASLPEVPLQDGEVVVHLHALLGTPLKAQLDSADLAAKEITDTGTLAEARTVLSGMIDTATQWDLFPDTPADAATLMLLLLFLGAQVFCLDADTLVILGSGGDPSAKTRTMPSADEISVGLAANTVRSLVLCPSLVAAIPTQSLMAEALKSTGHSDSQIYDILSNPTKFPDDINSANSFVQKVQQNPAKNLKSISDLLPPDSANDNLGCGSGKLPLATGTPSAYIDTADFTFHDGYIQFDATFEANAECFTISDGTLEEKITLSVSGNTVNATLSPYPPAPVYTVNMSWWCEWLTVATFWMNSLWIEPMLDSIISSVIQGFLANKTIPTPSGNVPSPGKASWERVKVSPEGVVISGTIDITLLYNVESSRIWYDATPSVVGTTDLGPGTYDYPGSLVCKPAKFTYEHIQQDEEVVLLAKQDMLIEPVSYEWSLQGEPISGSGQADFTTFVKTAVPPMDGVLILNHQVEIDYREGWGWGVVYKFPQDNRMTLGAHGSDCNYTVEVELRATDASGRQFYYDGYIQVVGDVVQFGSDYASYMAACELASLAALSKVRLRPAGFVNNGKPLTNEQVVEVVKEAITSGDPNAQNMLRVFTMTRGVAALRGAFGARPGAASLAASAASPALLGRQGSTIGITAGKVAEE